MSEEELARMIALARLIAQGREPRAPVSAVYRALALAVVQLADARLPEAHAP